MDKNLQALKTFSSVSLWDDDKDLMKQISRGYASTKTEMQIETKLQNNVWKCWNK